MQVITDDDIRSTLSAADAVRWIREAVVAQHEGNLVAPARVSANLGSGRMVFTTGRSAEWHGYRCYTTGDVPGQQVVVVHDSVSGEVKAISIGHELGPRRTGAIGAVAGAALTTSGPVRIGLIGTGVQAWTQVWAHGAAVDVADLRVFSRDSRRRARFAAAARSDLGLSAVSVSSAEEAVRDAGLVILATSSGAPVLDTAWLAPDVLVTTLGPKQLGRAEFSAELVTEADQVVTDSAAQLSAYDPPALAHDIGTGVVELGGILAGATPAMTSGRRVFLSVGLAGTEVHLLGRMAAGV